MRFKTSSTQCKFQTNTTISTLLTQKKVMFFKRYFFSPELLKYQLLKSGYSSNTITRQAGPTMLSLKANIAQMVTLLSVPHIYLQFVGLFVTYHMSHQTFQIQKCLATPMRQLFKIFPVGCSLIQQRAMPVKSHCDFSQRHRTVQPF